MSNPYPTLAAVVKQKPRGKVNGLSFVRARDDVHAVEYIHYRPLIFLGLSPYVIPFSTRVRRWKYKDVVFDRRRTFDDVKTVLRSTRRSPRRDLFQPHQPARPCPLRRCLTFMASCRHHVAAPGTADPPMAHLFLRPR
jgi:hypothetical protein